MEFLKIPVNLKTPVHTLVPRLLPIFAHSVNAILCILEVQVLKTRIYVWTYP